jgi:hypothetical protein
VAGYGGGGDALSFKATQRISEAKHFRGLEDYLKSKKNIPDYLNYLKSRGLIHKDPLRPEFGNTAPSATSIWRERNQLFGLKGARCKFCKTVQFPRKGYVFNVTQRISLNRFDWQIVRGSWSVFPEMP